MRIFFILFICLFVPGMVLGQTTVPFGGFQTDPDAAVELSADELSIDDQNGSAVFTGNVVVGQGAMRISAQKVHVFYKPGGEIDRIEATGGMTLATASNTAQADTAEYSVATQQIILRGNVVLATGQNALMAGIMRADMNSGRAVLEGQVRAILQPQQSADQ